MVSARSTFMMPVRHVNLSSQTISRTLAIARTTSHRSTRLLLRGREQLVEQRATRDHVSAVGLSLSNQVGHDIGMSRGNIVVFTWILGQVEQERRVVFCARFTGAVRSTRNEVRLVGALADGPELVVPVVKQNPTRTWTGAGEARAKIDAVDHPVVG